MAHHDLPISPSACYLSVLLSLLATGQEEQSRIRKGQRRRKTASVRGTAQQKQEDGALLCSERVSTAQGQEPENLNGTAGEGEGIEGVTAAPTLVLKHHPFQRRLVLKRRVLEKQCQAVMQRFFRDRRSQRVHDSNPGVFPLHVLLENLIQILHLKLQIAFFPCKR